jgi:hypothetical protein
VVEVVRYGRYWAVYWDGELVCVAVYKKGAQAVARLLSEGHGEAASASPGCAVEGGT